MPASPNCTGWRSVIDPARVAFWKSDNLSKTKSDLFDRIGARVTAAGGKMVRGDVAQLAEYADQGLLPIAGCEPKLTQLIADWRTRNVPWGYWDRGYFRRIYACADFNRAQSGSGFYRWHINSFQTQRLLDVPDDRWKALRLPVAEWQKGGRHIVIAAPSRTYTRFHRTESWIADTIDALARVTARRLEIRDKEHVRNRSLQEDLKGAHCLVTHGSIAAVEAVVLGCPVFVDPSSAAAVVGCTDLKQIEKPCYPDRQPWLNSLAYSQWDEIELTNGALWKMLS